MAETERSIFDRNSRAPLESVHVYAQEHTSIYIYIYIYILGAKTLEQRLRSSVCREVRASRDEDGQRVGGAHAASSR